MKTKMRNAFVKAEGGLFNKVEKADVGSNYTDLGEQGVALMGWADPFAPDFSLPKNIYDATLKALHSNVSAHYTAPIGNEELKRVIAKKLKEQNHLEVDPLRNILITPGSDSGLFYSMMSCLNEGDEVIIPTPCYPNNIQNIDLIGAKPVYIELKAENEYQLDLDDFNNALTDKTKMVILTHPNNPTTTVFDRKSLEGLAEFIVRNDLILVVDMAFEDFTFENELVTPAALPGMWERTITVFSTSKGMGLSGYRVGYIVTNDVFMDAYYGCAVSILGATNTISQLAVIEAFKDPSFMKVFEEAFDIRRKKAYEIFNSIPNVSMKLSESGFLGWVDVSKLGDSTDIVSYLVKEAKVCVNDGVNYGKGGEGHFRIVLGVYEDNEKVFDALYRIKAALLKYQGL